MRTTITNFGNSKGVRIPKPLLVESGLGSEVEITAKKNEIRITPATPKKIVDTMLLSEHVLARDWLRPEEDEAWSNL